MQCGIAQKFGCTEFFLQVKPDFFGAGIAGTGPVFAGFGFLFGHGLVKAFGIDFDVFAPQRILRQVKRETVSIV